MAIPIYANWGVTKYLLYPVVFYMVWSKRSEFFPGLIIHLFTETSVMYVILFTTFLLFLSNYKIWCRLRLRWLFWIVIIPLPFVIWQFYQKYSINEETLIQSLTATQYYLSLFPFFYGILLHQSGRPIKYSYLILVFAIAVIIHISGWLPATVRVVYLAMPVLVLFGLFNPLRKGFLLITSKLFGLFLFVLSIVAIDSRSLTTTSIIFIAFVLYVISVNWRWLKGKASPVLLIGSPIAFLIIIISLNLNNPTTRVSPTYKTETDDLSLPDRIRFKSYEDRSPIWASTFLYLMINDLYLPPVRSESILIQSLDGSVYESSIESHNIYLALMRHFGIIVGFIVSVVFIYYLYRLIQFYRYGMYSRLELMFVSSGMAVGIMGATTGQFPLMAPFSFMYIGLIGYLSGMHSSQIELYDSKK